MTRTSVLYDNHAHGTTPTFRVRNRIFAIYTDDHHGHGRIALWCKAPPGAQSVLISSDPDRFFSPPYVGPKGWIGVRLDRPVDWPLLAELIADSYRMTAPKRLAAAVDVTMQGNP